MKSLPRLSTRIALAGLSALALPLGLQGCAQTAAPAPVAVGACDERLAMALADDAQARLILARSFKAGELVALANTPANLPRMTAPVDLCLVKLVVGPGYRPQDVGKPGAGYASAGIGIEVWLPAPARWNGVIRAYGSGGWAGGVHTDPTRLTRTGAAEPMLLSAVGKGYAVSSSDHGHAGNPAISTTRDASFTLREDGTPNTALWRDFAERSLHEQALKTKALVRAHYGRAQQYAYWDGYSTGGRQGYKLAQRYAGDFDGILAGAPAFNWTRFITAELYPQVVMQRELGGALAPAKIDAASTAAVAACGGAALGFLIDPTACRYDPARDAALLCAGETGTGGVAGVNTDAARCLKPREAAALNKIWYGQTRDGSHPDPQQSVGGDGAVRAEPHLWWGLPRGSRLLNLAGAQPFAIASVQVALSLQDARVAQADLPYLVNPVGRPADAWRQLDYAGLARAHDQGLAMQATFSGINTDDPDLAAAQRAGTKILSYHGWADDLIPGQGSVNYFARAAARMGGVEALQRFNRLYMIPGLAHDGSFLRSASLDPATGMATSAAKVPLPQSSVGRDELFQALRDWVEKGRAPERIEIVSSNGSVSMPLCPHPQKASYRGSGPLTQTASYDCR